MRTETGRARGAGGGGRRARCSSPSPPPSALLSFSPHLALGQLHQHLGGRLGQRHLVQDRGAVVGDDNLTVGLADLCGWGGGREGGTREEGGRGGRCERAWGWGWGWGVGGGGRGSAAADRLLLFGVSGGARSARPPPLLAHMRVLPVALSTSTRCLRGGRRIQARAWARRAPRSLSTPPPPSASHHLVHAARPQRRPHRVRHRLGGLDVLDPHIVALGVVPGRGRGEGERGRE